MQGIVLPAGSSATYLTADENLIIKDYLNRGSQNGRCNCNDKCETMTPSKPTSVICNSVENVDGKMDNIHNPPKHPHHQGYSSRLESFVAWPGRYVPKTPEELAAAGFFYIGSADRVTCFQCGITLRDWEEEHDPITEHKRYAPNCDFVNETNKENINVVMKSEGVCAVTSTTQKNTPPKAAEPRDTSNNDETKSCKSANTVTVTSDIQYSTPEDSNVDLHLGGGACARSSDVSGETVADVSDSHCRNNDTRKQNFEPQEGYITGNSNMSTVTTIQEVTDSTPKSKKSKKFATLLEENRRLKEQTTCRVCKHQAATILFLPCGHLITCSDCADKVHDCVYCRRTILGTVKTFRA